MSFNTQFKTFAFPATIVANIDSLVEKYGEEERDGLLTVKTLACGWDDSEHTRLRALRFPATVSLTELTDGRYAYTALWSNSLLEAISNGEFPEVQELTQEELQALTPVPTEEPYNIPSEEPVLVETNQESAPLVDQPIITDNIIQDNVDTSLNN